MNARDRIAEALHGDDLIDEPTRALALHQADAVLAVLPDLLTDPELVDAVALGVGSGRRAYVKRVLNRAAAFLRGQS